MNKVQEEIARSQQNPKLEAEIKQWALKFIAQLEEKNNVKVIFAAETGSRGYGTNMEDSDFDIKGYFISSPKVYMSVMGGPTAIRDDHVLVQVDAIIISI